MQVEAEAAEKERAKAEEEQQLRKLEADYSATVARLEQRVQEADQQSQLKVRAPGPPYLPCWKPLSS